MNCSGIEVKYKMNKRVAAKIAAKDEAVFEIYSPVFDIQNVTFPVSGPLSGQTSLEMQSFFLVYDSPEHDKLAWVPVRDCIIVNHPYRGN